MKIWLINQYAIPPTQAGITRHYNFARELIAQGHEVVIIASSFDNLTLKETRLELGENWRYEICAGVPFLWLRTPPYSGNTFARVRNMLAFASQIWLGKAMKQLSRPDVILGSSPHLFGAVAAERLAGRLHVPFVLEVRDLWPQSFIDLKNVSPNHPLVFILTWMEKYLYSRSQKIVSLLPGAVSYIVEKGARPDDVVWIPNGIILDKIPEPSPPQTGKIFTLMYAGAHGFANGLDTILDTASVMKRSGEGGQICFRLIGDGAEKARLQQRAIDEDLTTVRFEPPVPKSEINQILQEADAFIMLLKKAPVFRWGLSPNKLFDYMAMARPIIFSVDLPQNPVSEVNAGISVPAEDISAMVRAIKELIQMSSEERWAMGLRGRKYVLEHHNMTRLAQKMADVLQEAVVKYRS